MEDPCKKCALIPYYACFCYQKAKYNMFIKKQREEDQNGLVNDITLHNRSSIGLKIS